MRVIEISNKTYLVRHWFKWYRVQKAGRQWEVLITKPTPKPFNLDKVVKDLHQRAGDGNTTKTL